MFINEQNKRKKFDQHRLKENCLLNVKNVCKCSLNTNQKQKYNITKQKTYLTSLVLLVEGVRIKLQISIQ